ncbi:hypothetical protein BGZ81_004545 [Podila clonocystis]|nr:hypothetical protein BGZ81_004545 [Podila clonocystis]
MSTKKTVAHSPALEPIDKRVPPEIWERIFNHLYPSQLSRFSMVNKNFNVLVSSLSVWSRMFSVAYGSKKRLRTLRNVPESKSYMLFMCANSCFICENCLVLSPYNATASYRPRKYWAPLPTLSTKELEYLGEELNLDWQVYMCSGCRNISRPSWPSCYSGIGNDRKTEARMIWYRTQL